MKQRSRRSPLSPRHPVPKRHPLALAILTALAPGFALANPAGMSVQHGSAQVFTPDANTLEIHNSAGAILNWQSFSIGAHETTRFVQPSVDSAVLNRVVGADPSQILGSLQSNGRVFLVNPNGIVFGAGARVDVQGLVASTLNISDADFIAGRMHFEGNGSAGIVNQGFIKAGPGGEVVLVAPTVTNSGIIHAPDGTLMLAAGQSVTIESLDFDHIRFEVQAPENEAINLGELIAERGAAGLFGSRVTQGGRMQANSLSMDAAGRIVIGAVDTATLTADSVTEASSAEGDGGSIDVTATTVNVSGAVAARGEGGRGGSIDIAGTDTTLVTDATLDASGATGGGAVRVGGEWQGGGSLAEDELPNSRNTGVDANSRLIASATAEGDGGEVVVWADGVTDFRGHVEARGGANGGDGGAVEISGKRALGFSGTVDVAAPTGKAGFVLFDPVNAFIEAVGGAIDGQTALLSFGDFSGEDRTLSADSIVALLSDGADVTIQANNDIFLNSELDAGGFNNGSLTLQAGRSVLVNAGIITGGGSVDITANVNLVDFADDGANDAERLNGPGSILMSSAAFIDTFDAEGISGGSVSLTIANGREGGSVEFGNVLADSLVIDSGFEGVSQTAGTSTEVTDLEVSTAGNTFSIGGSIIAQNLDSDAFVVVESGATLEVQGQVNLDHLEVEGDAFISGDAFIDSLVINGGFWEQVGGVLPLLEVTDFRFLSGHFLRALGGTGGPGNPWQIADVYGLQGLASDDLLGDSFVLANDIDAITTANWTDGEVPRGFRPIGDNVNPFEGSLDGNDHTIMGLYIEREFEDDVGLFGKLAAGSEVLNLSLDSPYVRGSTNVGALAGRSEGFISNVWAFDGDVGGEQVVGGLIGLQQSGLLGNSSYDGIVRGIGELGGLIGRVDGSISDSFYDYEEQVSFEIGIDSGDFRRLVTRGALGVDQYLDFVENGFLDIDDYFVVDAETFEYLITSAADFQAMLGFADQGVDFLLVGDIDLTDYAGLFIPYFNGNFDGDGHTIGSLQVSQEFNSRIGLFGENGGDIFDLNVNTLGSGVIGDDDVGIAVGINFGQVDNVHTEGLVRGNFRVGGLAGQNIGSATTRIDRSSSNATVVGIHAVGGLVGTSGSSIRDSHASGVVNATGDDVGGLIGDTFGSGAVYERNFATGAVAGRSNVGGLIGRLEADSTLRDSYATGSVTATNARAGGLVGSNLGSIETSYSTGSVAAASSAGGLVGELTGAAIVTDSYWDTQSSGQASSAGGTGLTSAQMRQQASFEGFDFSNGPVWQIVEGVSTPTLTGNEPIAALFDYLFDNGAGDFLWSNPLNWDNDILPTVVGSNVTLDFTTLAQAGFTGPFEVILDLGSYTLASLTSDINLRVTGGSLLVTGLTDFADATTFTVAGGAVQLQGAASFDTFVMDSGTFQQITQTLPAFSANDFQFTGGDFIRAAGGDGSAGNPWIITDVYGLQGMASDSGLAQTFQLGANIDASSTSDWNGGAGFVPIGDGVTFFSGSLDGAGFSISNLFIDRGTFVGLFGRSTGTLTNITLTDVFVRGNNANVGGLVGDNDGGTITRATVTGQVIGNRRVGGIVGDNGGFLRDSTFSGQVSGQNEIGGLVGDSFFGEVTNSFYDISAVGFSVGGSPFFTDITLGALASAQYADWAANNRSLDPTDYFADGPSAGQFLVTSSADLLNLLGFTDRADLTFIGPEDTTLELEPGFFLPQWRGTLRDISLVGLNVSQVHNDNLGLVGLLNGTLEAITLEVSSLAGRFQIGGLAGVNRGAVLDSVVRGTGTFVQGTGNVGGMVGFNAGTIRRSFTEALAQTSGTVGGTDEVGGLVGRNNNLIEDSFSTLNASGASFVGGLAGSNNSGGVIRTSYSTGTVAATGEQGGLVGGALSAGGTVVDSYWNTDTSGQATSAGGVGLTEQQMSSSTSFDGFDFQSVWGIDEGNTLPYLGSPGVVISDDFDFCSDGFVCFTGFNGFNWNDPVNWSTGVVPGLANENVELSFDALLSYLGDDAGSSPEIFLDTGSFTIGDFFSDIDFFIAAGSLTVNGFADVPGAVTVRDGGLLDLAGGGNLASVSMVTGETAGSLRVSSNVQIDELLIQSGLVDIQNALATATVQQYTQTGGTLTGAGRLDVVQAFALAPGASHTGTGITHLINPDIRLPGTRTLDRNFIVDGAVALLGGETLTVNKALLVNGLLSVAASGAQNARIDGTGSITIANGGTANLGDGDGGPQYTLALDLDGGINNQGSTTLLGIRLDLEGGTVFENTGSVIVQGGVASRFSGSGRFNNRAGALLDVQAGAQLVSSTQVFPTNEGLLRVNGQFDAAGDTFTNALGATLSGTGSISVGGEGLGTLVNAGTISPGNSPGTLTLNGNFLQTATGVLRIEVLTPIPGTGYDVFSIGGNATFGGSVFFQPLPGYTPVAGQNFAFVNYASASGTLASAPGSLPIVVSLGPTGATFVPGDVTDELPVDELPTGDEIGGLDQGETEEVDGADTVLANLQGNRNDLEFEEGSEEVIELGLIDDDDDDRSQNESSEEEVVAADERGNPLVSLKRTRKICN